MSLQEQKEQSNGCPAHQIEIYNVKGKSKVRTQKSNGRWIIYTAIK